MWFPWSKLWLLSWSSTLLPLPNGADLSHDLSLLPHLLPSSLFFYQPSPSFLSSPNSLFISVSPSVCVASPLLTWLHVAVFFLLLCFLCCFSLPHPFHCPTPPPPLPSPAAAPLLWGSIHQVVGGCSRLTPSHHISPPASQAADSTATARKLLWL